MKIPTPREVGLPEHFCQWRPKQLDALELLLTSKRRVKALSMPTGSGKSAVYVAAAILSKQPTVFVTDSRGLQDQLMAEFKSVGMVDIRGRANYPCDLKPDYTCQEGYAARCPHKGTVMCPSTRAEMRAAASSLVVTNYDKWTSARKYGLGMDHFTQAVFDEAHTAPDAVSRAMQVTLNYKEIEELLGLEFPPDREVDEFVNWKPWAAEAKAESTERMLSLRAHLSMNPQPRLVKEYIHLVNLTRRLSVLATANPNNWIVDRTDRGFQFDVVRVGKYAETALLLAIPSIITISATLRPKTLYMLGIGNANFDYKEFDSDFDPARCPIYFIPTMRVDKNAQSLAPLWVLLDQIAARRTDRKGIVHTISFARREELLNASRFSPHMIINPRGEASTAIVNDFKMSPPGTILVSPSVGHGYDFPNRDCEWQFVCKIPFPDGRSKIVKARQEDDKEYGAYQAMNKLVQIFGRGMRHHADRCENFIGDEHLEWFLPRYKHLAPKSFHGFYRRISTLPAPPPRL